MTECRLQAARKLLESPKGGKSITEVALAVGYNDLSNFHRMFKRKFGETPEETHRRWHKESAGPLLFAGIGLHQMRSSNSSKPSVIYALFL
jgi:AraC-like DNA-binding protein